MGTEFAEITLKTDHIVPEQKLWRGVLFNALDETMFQLHAGMTFGYKKIFDPQILPDISYIWQIHHKKAFENKAKILKLKVVRGGKDVKH